MFQLHRAFKTSFKAGVNVPSYCLQNNHNTDLNPWFGKSQSVIPLRYASRHYIDTFLVDVPGVVRSLKASLKDKINVLSYPWIGSTSYPQRLF
jgi:hypothetical protein